MHATVVYVPIRTAVLGARFSPAGLTPFAYAGSTTTFSQQPQKTHQNVATKFLPKRPASSLSTRAQSQGQAVSSSQTRLSCQQSTVLLPSSAPRFAQPWIAVIKKSAPLGIRANSTTSAASTDDAHPAAKDVPLDWNTFFKLRTSRRRYTLFSSIIASIASTAVGMQILSTQDLEALGAQVMGLDPFVVLGLATAACGAAGWLAGPFLGNAVWSLVHRRFTRGVAVKEKEFYHRIRRFRVDPSSNSLANPVPDYYGEKIGSVRDYRQWLKDQRAYNRKRRSFIL